MSVSTSERRKRLIEVQKKLVILYRRRDSSDERPWTFTAKKREELEDDIRAFESEEQDLIRPSKRWSESG